MCTRPLPSPHQRWLLAETPVTPVPGWPFRAHLLHVAEATQLPWRAVAMVAGLDSASAQRLMRCPRQRGTIAAGQAAAVLGLDAARLGAKLRTTVPSEHSRRMIAALCASGASVEELAHFLGLSRPALSGIVAGATEGCDLRIELLLSTAVQAVGIRCPEAVPPQVAA